MTGEGERFQRGGPGRAVRHERGSPVRHHVIRRTVRTKCGAYVYWLGPVNGAMCPGCHPEGSA